MRLAGSILRAALVLLACSPASCSPANGAAPEPDDGTGGAWTSSGGSAGYISASGGAAGSGASNGGASSGGAPGVGGASGSGNAAGTGGDVTSAGGATLDAGGTTGSGGTSACTTSQISVNDANTGTGSGDFEYQGDWSTSSAAGKFQDDDHYSASTGATAIFRFEGVNAALHAAKASHHGIAEISLDGGSPTDVDLYSASRAEDVEVWNSGALSAGSHELRIRVAGRQNAASSGTTIAVDRVDVETSSCSAPGSGGSDPGSGGSVSSGGAGGASTGGDVGSGGAQSSGGNVGTGGATTGVPRPAYNTGNGFYVVGNKLYDAKGVEFRIRGVNKLHWDSDSPGIPKTHANTTRWDIDFTRSASANVQLIQKSVDDHIVPMPGNWTGTCDESTAKLTSIVDTWVAQAATWKTMDRYMILNVANEWGPSGTAWRDAYIDAVSRLRAAGYLCTISVTAGGCGQDNDDLANYAKAVFDSDPQKNVIFDQHIYGNWANGGGQSWQTDLATGLDRLAATGLPMIVGEFGPGRGIGPSPTNITPEAVMQACETRGLGWLAWAWDDPAYNADDGWFALSKTGDYDSSADLTMFGKSVVENSTYGLLVVAHPATIF